MTRWLALLPALVLGFLLTAAEPGVKSANDPEKAGPDFKVQGEYLGETAGKAKLGAEVIARGDGKFDVNFLPGGLRGEGGDYARRAQASGQTKDGKTPVASKDGKWTAVIADGKMTGKADGEQTFTLQRVVRQSTTLGQKPPQGAVVLFDGGNTDEWIKGKLEGGNLVGTDIDSKKTFKDHKGHVEFRLNYVPFGRGQGRSNSGVYVQHRYEVQVLDSFGLKGENNECGGIYGQFAPLVNMCYPPLQWQTYDFDFRAARFDKDGKKVAPAVLTLRHNGVLVHDKRELKGSTGGGRPENDKPGPLFLQGHGGGVQYRNIWIVETSASASK